MEMLFMSLYPLVAIISIVAYVPQVMSLIKTDDVDSFSLSAWVMWMVGAGISMGYGTYCLKDFMFCTAAGIGFGFTTLIVLIVVYKRYNGKLKVRAEIPLDV